MLSILDTESVPLLSPHARIMRRGPDVLVDSPTAQCLYSGASARTIDALRHQLDGACTIQDASEAAGVRVTDAAAVLGVLAEEGLVADVSPLIHAGSAADFLDGYFSLCDLWGRDIFAYPFWTEMASGISPKAVVLGWGIEFYHRVMGADEHNALALHFGEGGPLRTWLSHHFDEEADHGTIFLDGLQGVGLNRLEVESSEPLPSTRGLVQFLNGLAIADTTTYLGCYGVMHSPHVGQTAEAVTMQFDRWIHAYPFAERMLAKIRDHALLDIGLGHDHIVLELLLTQNGSVGPVEASRILGAARGVTQAFVDFFEGIRRSYSSTEPEWLAMIGRHFLSAAL